MVDHTNRARWLRPPAPTAVAATVVLAITAVLTFLTGSQTAASVASAEPRAACTGTPVIPLTSAVGAVEELALDASRSADSQIVHGAYRAAALAIVERAVAEQAVLRVVVFGASGVGARTVFAGSFAPAGADEVFNLAAVNRERCLARTAIDNAVKMRAPTGGGSDVAGALASLIADARGLVKPGGKATVTALTDGCQSPSSRGQNRSLTDLCGKLAKGVTAGRILRTHADEFSLGNAAGITVAMLGVGVERQPDAVSSVFARKLVAFWAAACEQANPAGCQIGSAVQ